MVFVIGGEAQGKLAYVKRAFLLEEHEISWGDSSQEEEISTSRCFYGVHLYIRKLLQEGRSPEEAIQALAKSFRGEVMVTQEIGCGIVPLLPEDRLWREKTGRACCMLAEQAERVIRIIAGIPIVIKEGSDLSK